MLDVCMVRSTAGKASALTLFLVFAVILMGGFFTFNYFLPGVSIPFIGQVVLPTAGAQFIDNPEDPNSEFSAILNSGRYTCDADECIVSGSMKVTSSSNEPRVVFRYSGDYQNDIYVDTTGDGILERWQYETLSSRRTSGSKVSFLTPTSYPMYLISGKLYVFYESARAYKYEGPFGGTGSQFSSDPGSDGCSAASEVCNQVSVFTATYNFCPTGVSSFPYCSGSQNTVSSSAPNNVYLTDEFKLLHGQTIEFFPKNIDGSPVADSYIRIKKYDLSCISAIDDGDACVPGQIKCVPEIACPSGYTYQTERNYCDGASHNSIDYSYQTDVCRKDTNIRTCQPPINEYTAYEECDGTGTFGNSQCKVFATKKSAPTGQQCFLLDSDGKLTSQQGEGLGGLACPGDQCALGEKSGSIGDSQYQQCVIVGTCNQFSDKFCPEGLVYDDSQKDCVFPQATACNPLDAQCVDSDSIRECVKLTIDGKSGWQWRDNPSSCPGDTQCVAGSGNNGDSCSCSVADQCEIGEITCVTQSSYTSCGRTSDPNSCLDFREVQNTEQGVICVNNELIQDPEQGCAFNTPGASCDPNLGLICGKDAGLSSSDSSYNSCICDSSKYDLATYEQFQNQDMRCGGIDGNLPQEVQRIGGINPQGGESAGCYEWVDFGEQCGGEFVCRETE